MNICFLIGKIVSDIEYKFVLNSKYISIAVFNVKVDEGCVIKVKAYDKMADWCYQKLVKGDFIAIEGKIDNRMEIKVRDLGICNKAT